MRCLCCGMETYCEAPFCKYHLEEQLREGHITKKHYLAYKRFFELKEKEKEKKKEK